MNAPFADPRSISWRVPVVLAMVVIVDEVIALGALSPQQPGATPLATRVLAALVSVTVISALLSLGRWTWLRTAFARSRPWFMVATIVVAVQVGVAASQTFLVAQGLTEPTAGLGADAGMFLTATTLVVIAVLGVFERHRLLNATLAARATQLEAAYVRSVDAVTTERTRLAARVRQLLHDRLGPTSMRPELFTPERLREVADATLRPLAHQLAHRGPSFDSAPVVSGSRTAVLQALRGLRPAPLLRPRILAATMLVLTFRFSIAPPPEDLLPAAPTPAPTGGPALTLTVDWTSLAHSITMHVATFVVVLVGARLLQRALSHGTRQLAPPAIGSTANLARDWAVATGGLTVLGIVSLTLLLSVEMLLGSDVRSALDATVALGFIAPLVIATVITSILPATEDALGRLRGELAATNQELKRATARANALLDHERRIFARHLHASVQAAVNAASLTIERAATRGEVDPSVITHAASLIEAAVERLAGDTNGIDAGRDGPTDLEERLTAIVATWEGLATCDIAFDPNARTALGADAVARATVCDLIAEACANAVIHGHARNLHIDAALDHDTMDELRLVVTDDGAAPEVQRPEGLGSRILASSTTHWELTHHERGKTLTALVPLR